MYTPRSGFTLLELLVVLGIVMILLGILLPSLAGTRRSAAQVACAMEMRSMAAAVATYAIDFRDHIPFVYEPRSSTDNLEIGWVGLDGSTEIPPHGYPTSGNFWIESMRDAFGGSYISDAVLCSEDTISVPAAEWVAAERGIDPTQVGVPMVRRIPPAFYLTPEFLSEDRERIGSQACKTATLSSVRFPSRKALIVEWRGFHTPGFMPPPNRIEDGPFDLNIAATDGSVALRSQADAVSPVLVDPGPHPGGDAIDPDRWAAALRQMAAFLTTRDGVRGRDW
jgi:type II secretory pathway pseudopilin PulG